jgi:hypothetical protein
LPALQEIAAVFPNRLELLSADALALDESAMLAKHGVTGPVRVAANLPYNIGTALLVKWLTTETWPPWWQSLTLMFQREVAERLRARFSGDPDYVTRWAQLPAGSRPLENPLGGAPGFVLENVYVLPGLPAEMKAMFETVAAELGGGSPIGSWRRTYRTTESRIVGVLEAGGERHPAVKVGSYPSFGAEGAAVEIVLKSSDPEALAAATTWFEQALGDLTA